jgi:hypothetical protein
LNVEPVVPPSREFEAPLTEVQFDAVAAVAGAVVQWPLDPVWKDAPAATRVRVPRYLLQSREEIDVPAGRAVLWSVGPDLTDDHGLIMIVGRQGTGDIVKLVPPPPAAKPKGDRR